MSRGQPDRGFFVLSTDPDAPGKRTGPYTGIGHRPPCSYSTWCQNCASPGGSASTARAS